MEITDFSELNVLNKLLGKIKYQADLDFYEFREFAGSPLISEIFRRLNEEYRKEAIRLGYSMENQKPQFIFDSRTGKTLKLRIDELTDQEKNTLIKSGGISKYVKTLISPLEFEEEEFNKLLKYAEEQINSSKYD